MLFQFFTRALVALMTLFAPLTCAWAAGDTGPEKFRLTPTLMDRMEAVAADLKDVKPPEDDDDSAGNAESVQDLARKLDTHPLMRAALARQKLSSTEYATAVLAALHAGMYLATEPGLKPPQRTAALSGFTPEQRANIDMLRGRKRNP